MVNALFIMIWRNLSPITLNKHGLKILKPTFLKFKIVNECYEDKVD